MNATQALAVEVTETTVDAIAELNDLQLIAVGGGSLEVDIG